MNNETILEYIDRLGLKHRKVAEALGMNENTWYQSRTVSCENITIKQVHQLAKFLGITPRQTFGLIHKTYLTGVDLQLVIDRSRRAEKAPRASAFQVPSEKDRT